MDPTSRLVRAEDALSAPVDDELVLLAPALEEYVGLDAIGRRIWDLLEEPRTVEELCGLLATEYEATAEQIAADVAPFLDELSEGGLVRVVDG